MRTFDEILISVIDDALYSTGRYDINGDDIYEIKLEIATKIVANLFKEKTNDKL